MTPLLIPLLTLDQILIPVLGVLAGGGALGAWLTYKLGKKKLPIDSNTAAAVLSEKAGNLALAIATRGDANLTRLEEVVNQQREDMNAMSAQLAATNLKLSQKSELVDKTRSEVQAIWHGFWGWYDNKIVARWEIVRQQPIPPDPPIEFNNPDRPYSSILGS